VTKPRITFEYYFNEYCGGCRGVLTKEVFDRYIVPAFCKIKSLCPSAKDEDLNRDEVLMCACEIAEKLYLSESTGMIKNENIDGYSVTYSDVVTEKDMQKIILKYLADTGCLYAGVE